VGNSAYDSIVFYLERYARVCKRRDHELRTILCGESLEYIFIDDEFLFSLSVPQTADCAERMTTRGDESKVDLGSSDESIAESF
jgi:hypothetical protein